MLTRSQDKAYKMLLQWMSSGGKLFKLGGPAGSGKSFLIAEFANHVGLDKCCLITPTGKAANNLQKAGLEAHTIHSTIYRVNNIDEDEEEELDEEVDEAEEPKLFSSSNPLFELKDPSALDEYEVLIIDEGSMVGGNLLKDILSFDKPVLIVGDPNQLAPVNDTSIYNTCDFYLEEIVRQAQGSPIIWLSQQVLAGKIQQGCFGNCMIRTGQPTDAELMYADMVLTDTNARRSSLNAHMRGLALGDVQEWVCEFDRVICRTNNPSINSSKGFMLTNGTQGSVSEIKHYDSLKAEVVLSNPDLGDYTFLCTNSPLRFPAKKRPPTLELGYALTVHLSQGSEWGNVIYDLSQGPRKRALYTAITRAKESVLVTL